MKFKIYIAAYIILCISVILVSPCVADTVQENIDNATEWHFTARTDLSCACGASHDASAAYYQNNAIIQLLQEQNDLIREQNKLLQENTNMTQNQSELIQELFDSVVRPFYGVPYLRVASV
jgi:pyrroline-5-carboxylate reductase